MFKEYKFLEDLPKKYSPLVLDLRDHQKNKYYDLLYNTKFGMKKRDLETQKRNEELFVEFSKYKKMKAIKKAARNGKLKKTFIEQPVIVKKQSKSKPEKKINVAIYDETYDVLDRKNAQITVNGQQEIYSTRKSSKVAQDQIFTTYDLSKKNIDIVNILKKISPHRFHKSTDASEPPKPNQRHISSTSNLPFQNTSTQIQAQSKIALITEQEEAETETETEGKLSISEKEIVAFKDIKLESITRIRKGGKDPTSIYKKFNSLFKMNLCKVKSTLQKKEPDREDRKDTEHYENLFDFNEDYYAGNDYLKKAEFSQILDPKVEGLMHPKLQLFLNSTRSPAKKKIQAAKIKNSKNNITPSSVLVSSRKCTNAAAVAPFSGLRKKKLFKTPSKKSLLLFHDPDSAIENVDGDNKNLAFSKLNADSALNSAGRKNKSRNLTLPQIKTERQMHLDLNGLCRSQRNRSLQVKALSGERIPGVEGCGKCGEGQGSETMRCVALERNVEKLMEKKGFGKNTKNRPPGYIYPGQKPRDIEILNIRNQVGQIQRMVQLSKQSHDGPERKNDIQISQRSLMNFDKEIDSIKIASDDKYFQRFQKQLQENNYSFNKIAHKNNLKLQQHLKLPHKTRGKRISHFQANILKEKMQSLTERSNLDSFVSNLFYQKSKKNT